MVPTRFALRTPKAEAKARPPSSRPVLSCGCMTVCTCVVSFASLPPFVAGTRAVQHRARTDGQRGEGRGDGAAQPDERQGVQAHGVRRVEEGEVREQGVGEGREEEALSMSMLGCMCLGLEAGGSGVSGVVG